MGHGLGPGGRGGLFEDDDELRYMLKMRKKSGRTRKRNRDGVVKKPRLKTPSLAKAVN